MRWDYFKNGDCKSGHLLSTLIGHPIKIEKAHLWNRQQKYIRHIEPAALPISIPCNLNTVSNKIIATKAKTFAKNQFCLVFHNYIKGD